jgi:outer membrane protein assembly factor BamB
VFRVWLRSLCALVVTAAAVLVVGRVLAPAEVLATVKPPYPTVRPEWPRATGQTGQAPLIVDDRVRVYASKRQVRADAPINAQTVFTAIWSYRRWPAQLSGVVAAGRTVVSHWSDGKLVAIDAVTGKIAWRATAPSVGGYVGHRTGAAVVWAPAGLHLAGDRLVVAASTEMDGYDVSTGERLWTTTAGCEDGFTTEGGQIVCAGGVYDSATGTAVRGFPTGPLQPLGCDVAASGCGGLRDGAGHGWMTRGATPERAVALDRPGSTIAAGLVFYPDAKALRSVDPMTGEALRSYPVGSQVLGDAGGRVVLLTPGRRLLAVTPRGGREIGFSLEALHEGTEWDPGRWQVSPDGYVAVERLEPDRPKDPDALGYYFEVAPVVIAAL